MKIVVLEVAGGNDKDLETGHRFDTPIIVETFSRHSIQADVVFYSDSMAEELYTQFSEKRYAAYVSRVNPGTYMDFTETKYHMFLERLVASGMLPSTEPETMVKLGMKQALFHLRNTKIASPDVFLYRTKEEFESGFRSSLTRCPLGRVLKQNRGAGGNGVYWVSFIINDVDPSCDEDTVIFRHANDASIQSFPWNEFVEYILSVYLTGGGFDSLLIDMPYFPGVKDGEVRCVMAQDNVICILHRNPKPDANSDFFSCTVKGGATSDYIYEYQSYPHWVELASRLVCELPVLQDTLQIRRLPYLWTVDFILGDDRYVLSEINCSCFGYGKQSKVGEAMVEAMVKTLLNK